ncbi:MAG TPA: M20/M25/M40 family metallo-hydrolase [Vicinamibacterales bacterium]|nr:M20/M25/M40 family metallo-hydrolase [Vicinamibacterales bacterium]
MSRLFRALLAALLAVSSSHVTFAQATFPTKFSPEIAARADVKQALAFIDRRFDAQVAEWIHLTEIPGTSGHEQKRAEYVKAELVKMGFTPDTDEVGNLWVRRKGTGGGPTVVFAAHMDTVHPLDTPLKVRREDNGTLHAPGIFDNTASLAGQLQAMRAMRDAKVQTRGDVIFLFTVQEEVGLKGMYHWIGKNPGVADMLVGVDGALGPVNYGALGIYWSRMKFSGEGAHTNNSRDQPNPVRAAAACITNIYTIPLPPPDDPVPAIYNVGGMMSAGNVVNAIPQEVTFTVDLRTVDAELLQTLDAAIVTKCEAAAKAQRVTFVREWIQKSEAGGRPEQLTTQRAHPIVQTAIDVLRFLDVPLIAGREALPTGSTDANVGVVNKIPSISVGRSRGGAQHTLQEWAHIESAKTGAQQLLLLAVALTEPPK